MAEMTMHVGGQVATGLEAVRETFADELAEVGQGGAAFAAVIDGEVLIAGALVACHHSAEVIKPASKGGIAAAPSGHAPLNQAGDKR